MNSQEVRLKGKTVGRINHSGDETFYVTRRDASTYMRKYNGFGITERLLQYLRDKGVESVKVIYDREGGSQMVYLSKLSDWFEKGVTDDVGHGRQVFMSEGKFEEVLGK